MNVVEIFIKLFSLKCRFLLIFGVETINEMVAFDAVVTLFWNNPLINWIVYRFIFFGWNILSFSLFLFGVQCVCVCVRLSNDFFWLFSSLNFFSLYLVRDWLCFNNVIIIILAHTDTHTERYTIHILHSTPHWQPNLIDGDGDDHSLSLDFVSPLLEMLIDTSKWQNDW